MSPLAFPSVTPAEKAATAHCLAPVCEDSLTSNICDDESVEEGEINEEINEDSSHYSTGHQKRASLPFRDSGVEESSFQVNSLLSQTQSGG